MVYDTPDDELEAVCATARKAGLLNIAAGAAVMAVGLATGAAVLTGVAAGHIIGAVNISWLLRIVRRGVGLEATKAARTVLRGYYVRFASTCLVLFYLISRGWFNPWQLIIGFSISVFAIIGVLIYAASNTFKETGDADLTLKNASKQRG